MSDTEETTSSLGIGGRSGQVEIGGTPVFVKRVPLTARELRPAHVRSTANIFGLPAFYHYGAGSAGFGAWRELAAHVMTTHWALGGGYAGFPLLYHWRVLDDTAPQGFAEEFGGFAWEGSAAVRERVAAIGRARHSLVLFLEHIPHTLADWLDDAAHEDFLDQLADGARFMSGRGFVHFDAHFRNILTDGRRVYFADLGLALSDAFALDREEAAFLTAHRDYDLAYVAAHLRRFPRPTTDLGPYAAAATLIDAFHDRLVKESKRTPYPATEIARALEQPDE